MKKILALILMIAFIVSCAPAEAPTEPEAVPEVKEVVKESTEQTPAEPAADSTTTVVQKKESDSTSTKQETTVIVEKQPVAKTGDLPAAPSPDKEHQLSDELSPQVKELLTRADKKVKSFSYTLAPPPDQLARDEWLVRGTKIRVNLYDDNYVEPETYYDSIFMDTEKKSARGVCLSQRTTRCAERGQEFPLSYADVMVRTPYQWLKSVRGTPRIISTELLYDRKVDVIEYKVGDKTYTQWIDQFSGLPVRVQVDGDKKSRYEYRYLAINSVTDEEMSDK